MKTPSAVLFAALVAMMMSPYRVARCDAAWKHYCCQLRPSWSSMMKIVSLSKCHQQIRRLLVDLPFFLPWIYNARRGCATRLPWKMFCILIGFQCPLSGVVVPIEVQLNIWLFVHWRSPLLPSTFTEEVLLSVYWSSSYFPYFILFISHCPRGCTAYTVVYYSSFG